MKKRFILPLTLSALMMITACTGPNASEIESGDSAESAESVDSTESAGESTSVFVANSVTITNKDALTADWFLGDANRQVNVAADPEIEDIGQALDDGDLVITSSAPTVVQVLQRQLKPLTAGEATITVAYGGKTDSVTVTVKAEKTAIEKYGTVHLGTAEDPFDEADAHKVGLLQDGTTPTTETFYIKGVVTSWYHFPGESSYTSWFLATESTEADYKPFECYKVTNEDGTNLSTDQIWEGAEVVVKGNITIYSGQPETSAGAIFVENTGKGAEKPAIANHAVTAGEAVTAGKALSDGNVSWDTYTVTGYVASISGTNYFLADEKDATGVATDWFEIYGYDVTKLGLAEGSEAEEITKNCKVEITCHLKNYHGQVEGVVFGLVKIVEKGSDVVLTKATVTEALTAGNALDPNATTEETYEIEGWVVKTGSWSDYYGNGDFYIADDAAETDTSKMLQIYRANNAEVYAQANQLGAKVKVISQIVHYVKYDKNDATKVTAEAIETVAAPKIEVIQTFATVNEAIEISGTLANNQITEITYVIKGYVVDLGTWNSTYNNADVKIAQEEGETDSAKHLILYRFNDATVYGTLAVGDYVQVTAKLTRYLKTDSSTGAVTADKRETAANPTVVKLEKPVILNNSVAAFTSANCASLAKTGGTIKGSGKEELTWTMSSFESSTASVYKNADNLSVGSKNDPLNGSVTFTTTTTKKVSSVVVNAKIASSGDTTVAVSFAGTSILDATALTTTAADYTGTVAEAAAGEIVVTFTNVARQFSIFSITVNFAA